MKLKKGFGLKDLGGSGFRNLGLRVQCLGV